MAKHRSLVGEAEAGEFFAFGIDLADCFGYVIYVALGIDPSRDRKPHELHRRVDLLSRCRISSEHNASDFDGTNACLLVERTNDSLRRKFVQMDMRSKPLCVEINGVSACWTHN